jgi:hypothetical protein
LKVKIALILSISFLFVFAQWRQKNYLIETTIEHQMLPEKDTVMALHFHKVDNKFYVITIDSLELWVDNLKVINK